MVPCRTRRCGSRAGVGFTLIELLVVIAVIALLVAILLPALAGARKISRAAVCMSNTRQIGTALVMYANQYKEWIPREGTLGLTPQTERARLPWCVALRPFLDENASPAQDLNDQFANAPYYRDPARTPDNHKVHYVANGFAFIAPGVIDLRGRFNSDLRRGPMRLTRISFPAKTVYMTDFGDDPNNSLYNLWITYGNTDMSIGQFYDIWDPLHIVLDSPTARIAHRRHGAGANATYLDGHATLVRAQTLALPVTWDDGYYH
jgi:prepilin-type N-terminal cleavage/methylation domain-containing protein/prepilin-type processing-associated H-X9-DG protein